MKGVVYLRSECLLIWGFSLFVLPLICLSCMLAFWLVLWFRKQMLVTVFLWNFPLSFVCICEKGLLIRNILLSWGWICFSCFVGCFFFFLWDCWKLFRKKCGEKWVVVWKMFIFTDWIDLNTSVYRNEWFSS